MKLSKEAIEKIIHEINFDKIKDDPNILIAARFWENDRYMAAKVCYKFMRKIDDLIDNNKTIKMSFNADEKEQFTREVNFWIGSLDKTSNNNTLFEEVAKTIDQFHIPTILFENFARSMIFDINHNGFSSLQEFIDYSEGASVAPASIFMHLCCLNKENGDYALPAFSVMDMARPCAIFSYLVHIIRDFQKDQNNNLNYFALDILRKNKLEPLDLKKIATGSQVSQAFRNVMREYCAVAEAYKIETERTLEKLSAIIDPQYYLSLKIIFGLYLHVFEKIDIEHGNFTTEELNPSPIETKEKVLEMIMDYTSTMQV